MNDSTRDYLAASEYRIAMTRLRAIELHLCDCDDNAYAKRVIKDVLADDLKLHNYLFDRALEESGICLKCRLSTCTCVPTVTVDSFHQEHYCFCHSTAPVPPAGMDSVIHAQICREADAR